MELGDPLARSFGLPMHRVLKSFQQLLEVGKARFEEIEPPGIRVIAGASGGRLGDVRRAAELPDPRDQSLVSSCSHRLPARLDGGGT
ncbi:MAG: hypothetical protein ACRDPA_18395 [Solirubrobacteraceae bacterium]